MTKLAARVDELELDLLGRHALCLLQQGLAQRDGALLGTCRRSKMQQWAVVSRDGVARMQLCSSVPRSAAGAFAGQGKGGRAGCDGCSPTPPARPPTPSPLWPAASSAAGHTWDGALDHEVVLLDHTIVREAAHGGDLLGADVKVGTSAVAVLALLAELVHLVAWGGGGGGPVSTFTRSKQGRCKRSRSRSHMAAAVACHERYMTVVAYAVCADIWVRTFLLISVRWWKPC